jgi:hypothetical protein
MADKIRIGGLMRCCIETIRVREQSGVEGEVQPCKWCSSSTRFVGGAWEWNRSTGGGTSNV